MGATATQAKPEPPPPVDNAEPEGPSDETTATSQAEPAPAADLLPTTCATMGDLCLPPAGFAPRVCSGKNPDLALYMMQKGQPWTHGYIRVENIDTINTLGGPTGDTQLVMGEEVIVLRGRTEKAGNVQVSGTGGYIVLRWDGTCATLAEHELVTWIPGLLHHATLVWKYLGDDVQAALLENGRVREARKKHREQCQGANLMKNPVCLKATERLNEAIVLAVRTGTKVPSPERLR